MGVDSKNYASFYLGVKYSFSTSQRELEINIFALKQEQESNLQSRLESESKNLDSFTSEISKKTN